MSNKLKAHSPNNSNGGAQQAKFSFYKKPISNTTPNGEWTLEDAYRYITTNEKAKKCTEELRQETDEDKQRSCKMNKLDSVTFSGTFTKRSANNLINHSGYLAIDIDHIYNGLEELKSKIINDNVLQPELVFTSPRGNGLKAVVTIDLEKGSHLMWYHAVKGYIKETYGVDTDDNCKDVCRACFLPYDENCYFNINNYEL